MAALDQIPVIVKMWPANDGSILQAYKIVYDAGVSGASVNPGDNPILGVAMAPADLAAMTVPVCELGIVPVLAGVGSGGWSSGQAIYADVNGDGNPTDPTGGGFILGFAEGDTAEGFYGLVRVSPFSVNIQTGASATGRIRSTLSPTGAELTVSSQDGSSIVEISADNSSGSSVGVAGAAGLVALLPNVVQFQGQTVAALGVTGVEGQESYATNGRKVGEGVGAGTGVPVYFSNGHWRVYSTDAAVAA